MRIGLVMSAAALALLGGCNKPAPATNQSGETPANATAPVPTASGTDSADLKSWLIGSWSFEDACDNDFIVHYSADGSLDNSGNIGTWTMAGDKITETVTQKPDDLGEGTVKVDPPEVIVYSVVRGDRTHGTLSFQGRNVPIIRC